MPEISLGPRKNRMRYRVPIVIFAAEAVAISVAAVATNFFWRELVKDTYGNFLGIWSATTLSLCFQIIGGFFLTELLTFGVVWSRHGGEAVRSRVENFKTGLIVFCVIFLVYPITFLYQLDKHCKQIRDEAEHLVIPKFCCSPKAPIDQAEIGVQGRRMAKPAIIEIEPSFGNISDRAVDLSHKIMDDLYRHGWNNGGPYRKSPEFMIDRFPTDDQDGAMGRWINNRSNAFRSRFLDDVVEMRNEFAQFHMRDEELDENLRSWTERAFGPELILPQQIETTAKRLQVLAAQARRIR